MLESSMRIGNRTPDQLRPVTITPGYVITAEGSVLIEFGHTRVLCNATVEDTVPSFLRGSGKGWVTAEYAMLPRATATRTPREVNKGRQSGRTMEIQRLIGRSLRTVVDLTRLGERSVLIDCDVIQADGGTRTAAITGAWVAMAIAMRRMVSMKAVKQNPLLDHVAAISVGIVNGTPLLDLCYEEDSTADVDMNIVLTGAGQFIELQATAEKQSFGDAGLEQMIALGRSGVQQLIALQKEALERGA
jgi:ribonuclease PH